MKAILAEAGTQASTDDTPMWSTFDIGKALTSLRSGSIKVKQQMLRRLHVRWYHPSATKMITMFGQAGMAGLDDMIKDICNTCRICRNWAPPAPRPMAKTRMATKFNEVVQVDLLFWTRDRKQHILLHTIQHAGSHGQQAARDTL